MQKNFKITGEIAFATAILVFILVIIVDSMGMPAQTSRLPLLIAWVTLFVTIIELILCIRKQLKGTVPDKKKKISYETLKKLAISVMFMSALVALWVLIGFIAASLIVSISFGLYLGAKNKLAVIITSIIVTAGIYILFGYLLKVPLPTGLLFTNLM